MTLTDLAARVAGYVIHPDFRDETCGLRCCELALAALRTGDYGVGAVLLDAAGNTLIEAQNQVFSGGYCSSGHAEMRLIDRFESELAGQLNPDDLKLVVSLEPCPMCLSRILLAGFGVVKYMAEDPAGGMVSRLDDMPPAWQNLASLQSFYHAHVSDALRQLAQDLAQYGVAELRKNLLAQRQISSS